MLFSKLGQLHIRAFVGSDRLVGFRDMRLIFCIDSCRECAVYMMCGGICKISGTIRHLSRSNSIYSVKRSGFSKISGMNRRSSRQ